MVETPREGCHNHFGFLAPSRKCLENVGETGQGASIHPSSTSSHIPWVPAQSPAPYNQVRYSPFEEDSEIWGRESNDGENNYNYFAKHKSNEEEIVIDCLSHQERFPRGSNTELGIEGWIGVCQIEDDDVFQAMEITFTKIESWE